MKALKGRPGDNGAVDIGMFPQSSCRPARLIPSGSLRSLAWGGIPDEIRPIAWQLLLVSFATTARPPIWLYDARGQLTLQNYLPLALQPRLTTLSRKRKEYSQLVDQYFGRGLASLDQQVSPVWYSSSRDAERRRFGIRLRLTCRGRDLVFRCGHVWRLSGYATRKRRKGDLTDTWQSLERILYVWAIRHPASGYVQGINDLVTPFFEVFLSAYIGTSARLLLRPRKGLTCADTEPELFDASFLPDGILAAIEADSFWCLSKLLDGIQDNYISHQPGIHRLVKRMSELIKRIDRESRFARRATLEDSRYQPAAGEGVSLSEPG